MRNFVGREGGKKKPRRARETDSGGGDFRERGENGGLTTTQTLPIIDRKKKRKNKQRGKNSGVNMQTPEHWNKERKREKKQKKMFQCLTLTRRKERKVKEIDSWGEGGRRQVRLRFEKLSYTRGLDGGEGGR